MNVYGAKNRFRQSEIKKSVRTAFYWLAMEDPSKFDCVDIEVYHYIINGVQPDVGSLGNWAKAAMDGLVDAGVLIDDKPKYVKTLKFFAPIKSDFFGMELKLIEHVES